MADKRPWASVMPVPARSAGVPCFPYDSLFYIYSIIVMFSLFDDCWELAKRHQCTSATCQEPKQFSDTIQTCKWKRALTRMTMKQCARIKRKAEQVGKPDLTSRGGTFFARKLSLASAPQGSNEAQTCLARQYKAQFSMGRMFRLLS
jgi:hypothetical protein